MPGEENKAVFRRGVELWASGDLSKIDEVVDAQYIGHVAAGDRDREGLKARITAFRNIFPDVVFTIQDQLAEGDQVASRLTARGTYQASCTPTTLIGMNISRIASGKIVEEWATWETLST